MLLPFLLSLAVVGATGRLPAGGPIIAGTDVIALPIPTPQQLAWQQNEIMALIHFNMATFFPGCGPANWAASSKPASFRPDRLNVSQVGCFQGGRPRVTKGFPSAGCVHVCGRYHFPRTSCRSKHNRMAFRRCGSARAAQRCSCR